MFNKWELEEDNDSDFGGQSPPAPHKVATVTSSQGLGQSSKNINNLKSNGFDGPAVNRFQNQNVQSSSSGFYSDEDIDDLDAEDFPHRGQKGLDPRYDLTRSKQGDHSQERNERRFEKSTGSHSLGGVTSEIDQTHHDKVTAEGLKSCYDETASMKAKSGLYTSEIGVDKIELARVIRHRLYAMSLADDLLNLPQRSVSWTTLLGVAKPYMEKGPSKPVKVANLIRKNEKNEGQSSSISTSSSGRSIDDLAKRRSVGFSALESDDEEEDKEWEREQEKMKEMRDNGIRGSVPLGRANDVETAKPIIDKWSTQTRKEVPVTKSMEQESWHDQSNDGEALSQDRIRSDTRVTHAESKRLSGNWSNWQNETSSSSAKAVAQIIPPRSVEREQHTRQTTPEYSAVKQSPKAVTAKDTEIIGEEMQDDDTDSISVAEYRRMTSLSVSSSSSSPPTSLYKPVDTKRQSPSGILTTPHAPSPNAVVAAAERGENRQSELRSSPSLKSPISGQTPRGPSPSSEPQPRTYTPQHSDRSPVRESTDSGDQQSQGQGKKMLPLASSWETAISQQSDSQTSVTKSPGRSATPPPRPPRRDSYDEERNDSMQQERKVVSRRDRPVSMPLTRNQVQSPQRLSYNDRDRDNGVSSKMKPNILSQSDKAVIVKRSISWSAAVESNKRPPLPVKQNSSVAASSSSFANWSRGRDRSKPDSQRDSTENDDVSSIGASHDFDGHVVLPPLSEYGLKTGVIIEGWLEKKSSVTGFWQKRYFILAESSTEFSVLRIFYKVVETSWGIVPLKLKAVIPISAIQAVTAVSSKIKTGKQFTLTFMCPDKENKPASLQNGTGPKSGILNQNDSPRGSKDPGSANSINDWGGSEMDFEGMKSKPMILKADSLKTKMLWTAMLEKVLNLYHNDE